MAKRIVLLSDGTGNSAAKVWRTNVWRLFQSLDLSGNDQVAIYDDGVGSSAFKPMAVLGGAFGWGLKRNVIDLYKFACRNYTGAGDGGSPDEIYAFGFSRGAFTIRIAVALILHQGLVRASSEQDLDRLAHHAYRAYRAERYRTLLRIEVLFRAIRDAWIALLDIVLRRTRYTREKNVPVDNIRFLGLWDTVAAYGLPIEEMVIGVNWLLWPLQLPDRYLSSRVQRACHVLSLDDERTTFHPVLWTEKARPPGEPDGPLADVSNGRISQVWFAGVHSNVGGGYPDDSLAHIPLLWIMSEARACGLAFKENAGADPADARFDPDAFRSAYSHQDKDGRIYDSRAGLGGYYRYGPRRIDMLCSQRFSGRPNDAVIIDRPKVHESVFRRIGNHAHAYAPIVLPARYDVVMADGRVVPGADAGFESPDKAAERVARTETVWNLVWLRRAVYFATVAVSLALFCYPLFLTFNAPDEYLHWLRWASEVIRLVQSALPGFTRLWVDAYARSPDIFLVLVGALAVLMALGSGVATSIASRMNRIWCDLETGDPAALPALHRAIRALRTAGWYRAGLRALKWTIVPALSALAILYLGLALMNRAAFNIADAAGWICPGTPERELKAVGEHLSEELVLRADRLCQPTGLFLDRRGTYRIVIQREDAWSDGPIPSGLAGFDSLDAPHKGLVPVMVAGSPLRRSIFQPWGRIAMRVGATGGEEYPFNPDPDATAQQNADRLRATNRPRASGELFFVVNDAVLALPGLTDWFYRNNRGTAKVTVTRIR